MPVREIVAGQGPAKCFAKRRAPQMGIVDDVSLVVHREKRVMVNRSVNGDSYSHERGRENPGPRQNGGEKSLLDRRRLSITRAVLLTTLAFGSFGRTGGH